MAISVGSLRSAAAKRKLENGFHASGVCELCQKPLRDEVMVAIDHECYEFVSSTEAEERGDAVSLFPVGSDCFKKIQRALAHP